MDGHCRDAQQKKSIQTWFWKTHTDLEEHSLNSSQNLRIMELDFGRRTQFGCNQVDPSSIQRHLVVDWEFAQADGQILPKQERQISSPGWARISLPRWASLLGKERVYIPTKQHSCWRGEARGLPGNQAPLYFLTNSFHSLQHGSTLEFEGTWSSWILQIWEW